MSQVLFASNSSPSLVNLDANFTELYNTWLRASGSPIGYGAGAGGTVTQITNKSTAVTLNKVSGQVVTSSASLAAGAEVGFTLNNTFFAATDTLICHVASAASGPVNYSVRPYGVSNGAVGFALKNLTGGALAEAVVINFSIIKAVAS